MTTPLQFFKLIYQHAKPDHLVAWGAVDRPIFFSVSQLLEMGMEDLPQDQDIFYTPSLLTKASRKKTSVYGSGAAWIDRDFDRNGAQVALLPPTVLIRSGKGEHWIYTLDGVYKGDDIERANKALLAHIGIPSDGTFNMDRLLRVPGTNNCKYKQGRYREKGYTEPLPCEIIEWNPQYSYKLEDLAHLQPYPDDLLTTPLLDNGGGVDRHKRDWKLASTLAGWSVSEYAIRYALEYYSAKAEERGDEYVNRTLVKLFPPQSEPPSTNGSRSTDEHGQYLNAILEPVARLVDPHGGEAGLAIRVSWGKRSVIAPATATNFISSRGVTGWLENNGAGNRIFTANDSKAKNLFTTLEQRCPDTEQLLVEHAGRYDLPDGTRVFVYGPHEALVYPAGRDVSVFWQPQIKLENRLYLDPAPLDPQAASKIVDLVQRVQVPEIIQPALGWLAAAPLKTLIDGMGFRLPVLLLYGFHGSGKSSLVEFVLLPLVGRVGAPHLGRTVKAVAADSTVFTVLGNLSLTRSWPVWFGEYRASNMRADDIERLLREMYDSGMEGRGQPDQSIKEYKLVAPAIVDGETPFQDGANAERTLALRLDKGTVEVGSPHWQAFQDLLEVRAGQFKQFAHHYLGWTLSLDPEDLHRKLIAARGRFQQYSTTARVVNNIAVAWVGLGLLQDFVIDQGWPVKVERNLDHFVTAISFTHTVGLGVKTGVDGLVEMVSHFWMTKELGAYFEGDILWFNLTKALKSLDQRENPEMVKIQLQQRTASYLIGPIRGQDGAVYWGVDTLKAQALGLDVSKPVGFDQANVYIDKVGAIP